MNFEKDSDSFEQLRTVNKRLDQIFDEIVRKEDEELALMKTVSFFIQFIINFKKLEKSLENTGKHYQKAKNKGISFYDYFMMIFAILVKNSFCYFTIFPFLGVFYFAGCFKREFKPP